MPQPASLQIPQLDPHAQPTSPYRPASVAATPSSAPSRRQQRASHSVVSENNTARSRNESSPYPDVYAHPAAVAYAAAHPRRTIPKFGPYLLLQTLGEGEFGKVKLGLHIQWGEEVAVKLIRRGNVDSSVRMSKVHREIEVLKKLKHPNIVRLYDVIETDKYIGIILEYASGGELFDHILAHRHLRERDAAKLFSQLISGVWYIHQKKIVHRDLKLENLLLDRHRNVIITDFGFANHFEHKSDDLMQTSCGSPCYAAPELVISEGLYVGSAVDIWSCGVILYAMLAGYLPFDDDPANPDGDNINLLYRYIVSTPLSFPDFVSSEARDLLSLMLVPDPTRRANLDTVMRHPWLAAYHSSPRTDGVPSAFGKSVEDLEAAAVQQHQQKRLAYQKQMKANAALNNTATSPSSRSYSHHPEQPPANAAPSSSRSRSVQPEFLYDSSLDQSTSSPAPQTTTTPKQNGNAPKTFESPAALGLTEDDPFAPPPQNAPDELARQMAQTSLSPHPPTEQKNPKGHRSSNSGGSGGPYRHTIQVEYDDPKAGKRSEDKRTRERSGSQGPSSSAQGGQTPTKERRPSQSKPLPPSPAVAPVPVSSYRGPPTPSTPRGHSNHATPTKAPATQQSTNSNAVAEIPTVNVSSPPQTPSFQHLTHAKDKDKDESSQNSGSSRRGHKKGKSSIDKLGISKIFGGSNSSGNGNPVSHPLALNGSEGSVVAARVPSEGQSSVSSELKESPPVSGSKEGKKSRRNTLTVMVEPFIGTIRRGTKGRGPSTPSAASATTAEAVYPPPPVPSVPTVHHQQRQQQQEAGETQHHDTSGPVEDGSGLSASSNKARKVMQWFRTKSKGRESVGVGPNGGGGGADGEYEVLATPTSDGGRYRPGYSASSSTINQPSTAGSTVGGSPQVVVTQPASMASATATPKATKMSAHPQRSASSATPGHAEFSTPSLVSRFRNSVTVGKRDRDSSNHHGGNNNGNGNSNNANQLRIHHGAFDQTTITTKAPPEVMAHVRVVLEGMGVEIQLESQYKYRCIRAKRRKGVGGSSSGGLNGVNGGTTSLAAVQVTGSAASNGVDKRGLPLPSPSAFSGTGGMLRGLLMRRQSSQVSSSSHRDRDPSLAFDDEGAVVVVSDHPASETAYGDPSEDAGDEVRFSVELTRVDRLNDTYSLDIRRLKGNLRSYKWLYDTIRERADLQS